MDNLLRADNMLRADDMQRATMFAASRVVTYSHLPDADSGNRDNLPAVLVTFGRPIFLTKVEAT